MKELVIKVYIEKSTYGFSAYMGEDSLNYGCIGEGKTVQETIADFKDAYQEIKEYHSREGIPFQEATFVFYYDVASFLEYYSKAFSLAGLERITGVSQAQLGHYLHGRRKPSRKTILRIQQGVDSFAREITSLRFA